ncbi:MAG: LysR family transcriptional regulator [Burkholderiales bacterium]|nr:LysR family transcriptional regulator [Burkholderiales bacterium]
MTLQQLRYLCEIVRQGLHLSQAAGVLHTSQPGVSKQIKLLEQELGVVIFRRQRNRILELTQPGREIVRHAERILRETQNIRGFGDEFQNEVTGTLVIATTHTHARYTLPDIIGKFTYAYPHVRLEFLQGNRDEIFRWVDNSEADIAIGTDCDVKLEKVALLPYGRFHRIAVTRPEHPLLGTAQPSLEQITEYPLIAYGFRSTRRWKFNHIFEAANLRPNIVFSAADADVSKAYVELGIGISILPDITFDPARDVNLRAIDLRHLFKAEITHVGIKRDSFLRHYIFGFLSMLSPDLTRAKVERLLAN